MTPEHPLTVTQASRVLGISERTLRRILRQPEMQAQILVEHRHTVTGLRRSSLLLPDLIEALRKSKNQQILDQQITPVNTGTMPDTSVLAYERLLAEQAARINDLQETLTFERERLRQVTELLVETQQTLAQYSNALRSENEECSKSHQTLWNRLVNRS